jgi:hypothetical protein
VTDHIIKEHNRENRTWLLRDKWVRRGGSKDRKPMKHKRGLNSFSIKNKILHVIYTRVSLVPFFYYFFYEFTFLKKICYLAEIKISLSETGLPFSQTFPLQHFIFYLSFNIAGLEIGISTNSHARYIELPKLK